MSKNTKIWNVGTATCIITINVFVWILRFLFWTVIVVVFVLIVLFSFLFNFLINDLTIIGILLSFILLLNYSWLLPWLTFSFFLLVAAPLATFFYLALVFFLIFTTHHWVPLWFYRRIVLGFRSVWTLLTLWLTKFNVDFFGVIILVFKLLVLLAHLPR